MSGFVKIDGGGVQVGELYCLCKGTNWKEKVIQY